MAKQKIAGLCACPVGVAHTYMVADKLESVAKKLGYNVKVETQGFSGIDNKLTRADLEEASLIVLASEIAILEEERFKDFESKIVRVGLQDLLQNSEAVIKENIK